MMNSHQGYDVLVKEIHHIEKMDRPSGTAIATSQGIIKHLDRKTSWTLNTPTDDFQIEIHTERIGQVNGTHQVTYSSPIDEITIEHKAHNRDGFARGAIHAAHWVSHKKGMYTMKNMLSSGQL
ncbi:UNVERIFIED_CONTAM: hypothetical protein GTU68_015597 [Idotea baltica]|nr:hypothetical protein [Idotea baltica]